MAQSSLKRFAESERVIQGLYLILFDALDIFALLTPKIGLKMTNRRLRITSSTASAASCRSRLESQWETPKFDPPWSQNYWGGSS